MANPEHLKSTSFRKVISYILYVIAFDFLYSLTYAVQYTISSKLNGYSQPVYDPVYWIEQFGIGSNVPYVICHVVAAAIIIKELSLKKLFVISSFFIIVSQFFSILLSKPEVMASWGFGVFEIIVVLPYVAPVLILAIIQRKKEVPKSSSGLEIESASVCIESEEKAGSNIKFVHKRCSYVFDIVLIFLVLLYGTLFDPFGLINYLCGLFNELGVAFLLAVLSLLLLVPVLFCLLVLFFRLFISWPKHISNKRRLLFLRLLVTLGLIFYLALPFTPILPARMTSYIARFSKYVKANTDIKGIRGWLDTLSPEDCVVYNIINANNESKESSPKYLEKQEWPKDIAKLSPGVVRLSLDENEYPQVRLSWGSVFVGHWGFVVGNENLPTPASNLSWGGEYRKEIKRGVYVFYEIN